MRCSSCCKSASSSAVMISAASRSTNPVRASRSSLNRSRGRSAEKRCEDDDSSGCIPSRYAYPEVVSRSRSPPVCNGRANWSDTLFARVGRKAAAAASRSWTDLRLAVCQCLLAQGAAGMRGVRSRTTRRLAQADRPNATNRGFFVGAIEANPQRPTCSGRFQVGVRSCFSYVYPVLDRTDGLSNQSPPFRCSHRLQRRNFSKGPSWLTEPARQRFIISE